MKESATKHEINVNYNKNEKFNLVPQKSNQKNPLRDVSKCVTEADFDAFMKMYKFRYFHTNKIKLIPYNKIMYFHIKNYK